MSTERKRGKRGPEPKYAVAKGFPRGAPRLATRVDPDVLEWVQIQPEGVRQYIQRLVREDRQRNLGENKLQLETYQMKHKEVL